MGLNFRAEFTENHQSMPIGDILLLASPEGPTAGPTFGIPNQTRNARAEKLSEAATVMSLPAFRRSQQPLFPLRT
jgi:hypothetical protein